MIFQRMLSREWRITTIIVILGVALCVRLGIWQLDRLEQRKSFNSHVEAMWAATPIILPEEANDFQLDKMEYRAISATGEYDTDFQVALRNQYWKNQYGYHLITPLVIGEGVAVLVDRGWIPAEGNDDPIDWQKYQTDQDTVSVAGIIRLGQEEPDVGGRPDPTLVPGQNRLDFWNNVNLNRLANQIPYDLVGIYIQLDSVDGSDEPPIPVQPTLDLTEGPHLGYAGQWFTFASILFFGYPFYIRKRETS